MRDRLEQILSRCLEGRKIAVWGTPSRLLLRQLKPYSYEIPGQVDPAKHYVVAVTQEDLTDFLLDEQSGAFRDVLDYICFSDEGKELPFEWACCGAKIGRQTYFGPGVVEACREGYVGRIGSFTSINGTALIHVNHQGNMCFVSDDIQYFFSPETQALFEQRYLQDPKHPYGANKPPLTIGNDVWIGANAFINCSTVTTIGDGAIIGAGAVVLEDVPPYAIVVGVPGRIKRYRYAPELIETLLRVQWWNWTPEEINANGDALMCPELFYRRFGGTGQS